MKALLHTIPVQSTPSLKVASAPTAWSSHELFLSISSSKRGAEKPSPFKVQYQVSTIVQDSAAWDSQWFGNYE